MDISAQEKPVPLSFKILLYIIFIDVAFFTTRVWAMVFLAYKMTANSPDVSLDEFGILIVGYHILVLLLAVVNLFAHYAWKASESLSYYPLALAVGTISINFSASYISFAFHALTG